MHSFEPLSPSSFLDRSAAVHTNRLAVVDGTVRRTYGELGERVRHLAAGLAASGVEAGDRIAVLAPNTHLALEATLGVPRTGAVLVALNVRLAVAELAYIVDHAGARTLLCDPSLEDVGAALRAELGGLRVLVGGDGGGYETLLAEGAGQTGTDTLAITDERALLALNYTSGTTGRPKGVMYHHRGAYLQALAMAYHMRLGPESRYLWTLPMFHCNGWCFPWAVTLAGATHVCLPKVEPAEICRLIGEEGVTHLCAAPTVLSAIIHHPGGGAAEGPPIKVATGGAPPSPALLDRAAKLNIEVTHLYGLTESFGPAALCDWLPEWDELPLEDRARRKARQGVGNVISQPIRVVDTEGRDVPADGQTMGEIALRGNNIMLGYYRDEDATARAIPDGWFRTGDLGVLHPDGYVELRDRAKDIIISGGENIASVEVEQALESHPAVLEAAVVGMPHEKWGEVPVAFVTLHDEHQQVEPDELIEHVRGRIARFKAPHRIEFGPLPKTSTGKIRKYDLREQVRAQAALDPAERGAS